MTELESGKWYKLRKGVTDFSIWNHSGNMDFMKDGKPHECRYGKGDKASFWDSPDTEQEWHWEDSLEECENPFKVGSRVRVKESADMDDKSMLGKKTTIKELWNSGEGCRIYTEEGEVESMFFRELELIEDHHKKGEIRLGDKVRVNATYGHIGNEGHIGLTGVVVNINNDGYIGVEFKEEINGHSCSGKGKKGHCWNIKDEFLTRITTEENKMEKPKNKIEEKALEEAKKEAIKNKTDEKKELYRYAMEDFINAETKARNAREHADNLAKELGLTKDEINKLF